MLKLTPDNWETDFGQLEKVLQKKKPDRPVLFEFIINGNVMNKAVPEFSHPHEWVSWVVRLANGMKNLGYDYACTMSSNLSFPTGNKARENSISLNDGAVITDRESFSRYEWPDPSTLDYAWLGEVGKHLPEKMKLIVSGPCGVLENVIALCGYENLCMMIYDDPELVGDIFEAVGSRLVEYYRRSVRYDVVGAIVANDDWGFNKQTMLAPDDMRKYVFPWHKQIVQDAHDNGCYTILHSCGNYDAILDDVIEDMKFDGRHSYEDNITPVEQAYEDYNRRIAVMGGLDVDFMSRSTPQEIFERAKAMIKRTEERGGYALGTGNSVPDYISDENYFAMLKAAWSDTLK